MRVLRTASIALAAIVLVGSYQAAGAADEPREGPARGQGTSSKLEQALERAGKAAAAGIERGLQAAEHGVRTGVVAAARGIERGAKAAARAADHVAKQVERALPPAPPAGSERTSDTPSHGRRGRSDA